MAISCEQTYQQLCFLNDIEDIRGRVLIHFFIVNITYKNSKDEIFLYTLQKIAISFLNIAGFEIGDFEKDIDCLEIVS